jgi:putative membrane protein
MGMDPVLKAVLFSWEWRIEIVLVLVTAGTLYSIGWWRLRRLRRGRSRDRGRLATGGRLAAYLSALVILGVALMSPIDVLASQFFFMHMIQHLLLVMVVPPLLWLSSPFPFVIWGLPSQARSRVASLFNGKSSFRRRLRTFTAPGISWMLYVAVLLAWHDPNAYQAALQDELIHDLEHITFFATAMLFWWHVIYAPPQIHKRLPRGARIAYVLAAIPPTMAAGAAIAFSGQPVYAYYAGVPRLWGISVMQDQMLGGVIMWVPGSMMYIIAALILISRWVQDEDAKPVLPDTAWAAEQNAVVPGLER